VAHFWQTQPIDQAESGVRMCKLPLSRQVGVPQNNYPRLPVCNDGRELNAFGVELITI
jgi:hypothetical protein